MILWKKDIREYLNLKKVRGEGWEICINSKKLH
jgi:hypothetical protein